MRFYGPMILWGGRLAAIHPRNSFDISTAVTGARASGRM